jgi:hypothetical protein
MKAVAVNFLCSCQRLIQSGSGCRYARLLPVISILAITQISHLHLLETSANKSEVGIEVIAQARLSQAISVQAAGRGNPYINLSDGRDMISGYDGPAYLVEALEQNRAKPLSLASADFDEDGAPDLICGYAGSGDHGILTLHRGNLDAIYANTPEASQRKSEGTFTDAPFLSPGYIYAVPEAVDFMGAGDFDCDGHRDVVVARRGGDALYMFTGDGAGGFAEPEAIPLTGNVTALVVGEINRRDGLDDVAVAIAMPSEAKVLVFEGPEGALRIKPEEFTLPAQATALALGQIHGDYHLDLAVAAGKQMFVIEGRNRDLPVYGTGYTGARPARVSGRTFPVAIRGLAVGDVRGDAGEEVAVLCEDGAVRLLSERKAAGEKQKRRQERQAIGRWRSEVLTRGDWGLSSQLAALGSAGGAVSNLAVLDKEARRLHLLADGERVKRTPSRTVTSQMEVEGGPVALLGMRLNADAAADLVMLRSGSTSPAIVMTASARVYSVNSTGDGEDSNPGDGVCDDGSGNCTLRAALEETNATTDTDTISFNIAGAGPHAITPLSPLPTLGIGAVFLTIDGTTQPGFAGTPIIELNGEMVAGSPFVSGLSIGNTGIITIRGLVINRFPGSGIELGPDVSTIIIEGNYIGTDVTGSLDQGNGGAGIGFLFAGATTIGGTAPAARNVISGNLSGIGGIRANGVTIQGNFIGTDASGASALGSQGSGIAFDESGNFSIGGTTAGAGNTISGNQFGGIGFSFSSANLVQGNKIGTDRTGTAAVPNGSSGVRLSDAIGEIIGGTAPGAGNLISGNNGDGILLTFDTRGNQIQGNFIGTQVDGTSSLGNTGDGIHALDVAPVNTVGGAASGAGNIIAFNGGEGVAVGPNSLFPGNATLAILSNAIFSNGGLGIDLGDDGVTPNDACDTDTGPNNLQNFPLITAAGISPSGVIIEGRLDSSPNTSYLLQFFSNSVPDPSGFGEGEQFIGSASVTTSGDCNASFTIILPASVSAGQFITATATDPDNNTSEFSNQVAVTEPQQATLALIDEVENLVAQGSLNEGQADSLRAKLQAALKQMNRGNFNAAANQLQAFINQVEAFVNAGKLPQAQGQMLINLTNEIIRQISP